MVSSYLVDANVIIQAKLVGYYGFDICPGFWETLESYKRIRSIDKVNKELNRFHSEDEIIKWIKTKVSKTFFENSEIEPVIKQYSEIMNWAFAQDQYTDAAKDEFASTENADPWLIAHAKVKDCVVVTLEIYDASVKKKIKIPNVCKQFNVKYVTTFEMLRELKVKFDLPDSLKSKDTLF